MDWQFIRTIRTAAADAGRAGVDLLLQPQYPVSNENVSSSGELSAAGWRDFHFINEAFCQLSDIPFFSDYGDGVICLSCIATPPQIDLSADARG
ncbi:MAG: hypothetical protein HKP25_11330 [Marinicaulis sp.]|nr:hypothetical protein [Marinicaulis sp.]